MKDSKGEERKKTHAMEICIGSSASRPVSFSINPDPNPLIWTLHPVSAWISIVSSDPNKIRCWDPL